MGDHEKAVFRTGCAKPKITGRRDDTRAAGLAARGRITTHRDDHGVVIAAVLTA
jgi:hypothetical protein